MGLSVRLLRSLSVVAVCCMTVAGCFVAAAGAVGGAAVGGALVATDRRSMGMQLEDAQIEHRINNALDTHFARESVRIDVTSYNRKVLLAGQVPTEKDRSDAEAIAASSENVRQVVNELTLGSLAGLTSTTSDITLAGKVRGALLDAPGLPSGVIKVSCTDGSIYLFGRVSSAEAESAKRAASHVSGVKRVVALFDLLSDTEVAQLPQNSNANAQAQPAPPATGSSTPPAAESH